MGTQLTLAGAVDSFILNCRIKNLSVTSIRWYGILLRTFSSYMAANLPRAGASPMVIHLGRIAIFSSSRTMRALEVMPSFLR